MERKYPCTSRNQSESIFNFSLLQIGCCPVAHLEQCFGDILFIYLLIIHSCLSILRPIELPCRHNGAGSCSFATVWSST